MLIDLTIYKNILIVRDDKELFNTRLDKFQTSDLILKNIGDFKFEVIKNRFGSNDIIIDLDEIEYTKLILLN